MKYLYHLRYRFFHVILPVLFIVLFYGMASIERLSEMMIKNNKLPYSTLINQSNRMIPMVVAIMLILVISFYMIYRDLQLGKHRILLLPQSRNLIWIVDTLFIFSMMVCVIVIQFLTYRIGFNECLELTHKFHDFPYWQTKNVMESLYATSVFKVMYPMNALAIVSGLLTLISISLSVPFLYTMLSISQSSKKQVVLHIGLVCSCIYGSMLFDNVGIRIVLLSISAVWMMYYLRWSWNTNRIGG